MERRVSGSASTLAYYEAHAEEFCRSTVGADMSALRARFLRYLPAGGSILDAGCGSGRDSLAFREAGYAVTAMDASPAVCALAQAFLGQEVLCCTFQELAFQEVFDGIWACASLLHVPGEEMGEALTRLHAALKRDGILYCSFKYGKGERMKDGRLFSDYEEESVKTLLTQHAFIIEETFLTQDVRADRPGERWVNALARRA